MSSISQHISHGFICCVRTSIIYAVTDIISAWNQISRLPASCFAEVSLFLNRSHGQSETCCIIVPTRRKMYRSSTGVESWRSCPTAILLRSGQFLPRHPFIFNCQGALNLDISSRLIRKVIFPHLYRNENRVLLTLNPKVFLIFLKFFSFACG